MESRQLVCSPQATSNMLFRNRDCLDSQKNLEGHCCMTHFLSSGRLYNMVCSDNSREINALMYGSAHPGYLKKMYPCTDYLSAKDCDYIRWTAHEFSDIIPEDSACERIAMCEFDTHYSGCTVIPFKLEKGESLSNIHSVVQRILDDERSRRSWGINGCHVRAAEESGIKCISSDGVDLGESMWVFCADQKWQRVETMEVFRPNTSYHLFTLDGGNMVRMLRDDCESIVLFRQSPCRPTQTPDVSLHGILRRQIYIYRCIDGYWEYNPTPFLNGNLDIPIFPCMNPVDVFGPVSDGPGRQRVRASIAQMFVSDQTQVISDAERGYSSIDTVFGDAFASQVGKLTSVDEGVKIKARVVTKSDPRKRRRYEDDSEYVESGVASDSSSSDGNDCSESYSEKAVGRRSPRGAPRTRPVRGGLARARNMVPDVHGMIYSGVSGVVWMKPHQCKKFGVCTLYLASLLTSPLDLAGEHAP